MARRLDLNNKDFCNLIEEFRSGKWNKDTKSAEIRASNPKYSQYGMDAFQVAIKRLKKKFEHASW